MDKPEQHASTSKWFRVAVEGATTDGRAISRDWITQMARQYNRKVFGARVNLEHIRGLLPDGPFQAYGDVMALEARDETGEFTGKLGLYAQIAPTPPLVAMTKAKQKIYTSIEVDPSFADTKQAYLVGLAVTDSPASLGNEMLTFSATQEGDANPLASRKQSPHNLFTAAAETAIVFEPATAPHSPSPSPESASPSLFTKVGEILGLVKKKGADDDTRFTDVTQAVEALANHGCEQAARADTLAAQLDALRSDVDAQKSALAQLTTKLSQENASPVRPAAIGQHDATTTDC